MLLNSLLFGLLFSLVNISFYSWHLSVNFIKKGALKVLLIDSEIDRVLNCPFVGSIEIKTKGRLPDIKLTPPLAV